MVSNRFKLLEGFVKKALALSMPLVYEGALTYMFVTGKIDADVFIGAVGIPIVVVIIECVFRREKKEEEEE